MLINVLVQLVAMEKKKRATNHTHLIRCEIVYNVNRNLKMITCVYSLCCSKKKKQKLKLMRLKQWHRRWCYWWSVCARETQIKSYTKKRDSPNSSKILLHKTTIAPFNFIRLQIDNSWTLRSYNRHSHCEPHSHNWPFRIWIRSNYKQTKNPPNRWLILLPHPKPHWYFACNSFRCAQIIPISPLNGIAFESIIFSDCMCLCAFVIFISSHSLAISSK